MLLYCRNWRFNRIKIIPKIVCNHYYQSQFLLHFIQTKKLHSKRFCSEQNWAFQLPLLLWFGFDDCKNINILIQRQSYRGTSNTFANEGNVHWCAVCILNKCCKYSCGLAFNYNSNRMIEKYWWQIQISLFFSYQRNQLFSSTLVLLMLHKLG